MRSSVPARRSPLRLVAAVVLALAVAACDGGPTDPPAPDPGATLTVDASSAETWALVRLGDPAQVVEAADPSGSTGWDVAFRVTSVMLNGGENGSAGVSAYCVCGNADATDEALMAMTPETELQEFDAVTAGSIPEAGQAWTTTVFDERKWYRYDLAGNHQIWPTYDVYLVRRGDVVYKLQLTGYYGADGAPRQVTLRYARLAG